MSQALSQTMTRETFPAGEPFDDADLMHEPRGARDAHEARELTESDYDTALLTPQFTEVARRPTLDWKALQKALVFTKLVYRKPAVEKKAKAVRTALPTVAEVTAAAHATAPAPRAAAPNRHVDAYGDVDERLLPWTLD